MQELRATKAENPTRTEADRAFLHFTPANRNAADDTSTNETAIMSTTVKDFQTKPRVATYPASSIKRKRRSKAEVDSLKQSMLDILAENESMTIRQMFYQMVSRRLIDKTEAEYNNTVSRLATQMRKAGEMPFNAIADNTRWMRKPASHSSLENFLHQQQQLYRRDLWQDQDAYVEIWLEKDALAGVLYDVTSYWDVPLMVVRGYASVSFLWSAAEAIREARKPAFLYYFGDADPSGRDIPRAVERSLREMAPKAEITFEVVAVTDEQIVAMNLPTRPTKTTDSRAKSFSGESVEVDAIPPKELKRICRALIEQHVDDDSLAKHNRVEQMELQTLTQIVTNMNGR